MSDKDGGAAFPTVTGLDPVWYDSDHRDSGRHPSGYEAEGTRGMSLRDYFAAKAMAGFCANQAWINNMVRAWGRDNLEQYAAESAYKVADAMLESRK